MRTDPDAARSDLTQHRIKGRAIAAIHQRIHPDDCAIDLQQLRPHLVMELLGVDGRLHLETALREHRENVLVAIVVGGRATAFCTITAPHDCDAFFAVSSHL